MKEIERANTLQLLHFLERHPGELGVHRARYLRNASISLPVFTPASWDLLKLL